MKKNTPAASEKTNPIQTQYKPNFKGGIIIKNMNIEVEVEDPASVVLKVRPLDGTETGLPWTESNPISPPPSNIIAEPRK